MDDAVEIIQGRDDSLGRLLGLRFSPGQRAGARRADATVPAAATAQAGPVTM
jgi:hypothetical protein